MIQVRLVEAVREAGSLPVLGSVVHPNLSLLRLSAHNLYISPKYPHIFDRTLPSLALNTRFFGLVSVPWYWRSQ